MKRFWIRGNCACRSILAVLLLCGGCIGARCSKHDLVISGKPAPKLDGPWDPALPADLSTHRWAPQPFLGKAAEVGTIFFKDLGIQGWKNYHMDARATGIVVQHEFTSGPILGIDMRLQSLSVQGVPIPLAGTRYMRVVIFIGKISVPPSVYQQTNAVVVAQGKLVWNCDGWFEILPRKTGDVVCGGCGVGEDDGTRIN